MSVRAHFPTSMPPLSPQQRKAKNMQRRLNGSFWQARLAHLGFQPSRDDDSRRPPQGGFFRLSAQRGGGTTYDVQDLLARKWVNEARFYLVLWGGYREPTWEPEKNIPWQL